MSITVYRGDQMSLAVYRGDQMCHQQLTEVINVSIAVYSGD